MQSPINCLPKFIAFCAIVWLGSIIALAQKSVPEFHQILRETAAFDETDFVALEQGQTVVHLLPTLDKREVAVGGFLGLRVAADVFLKSFRESMTQKSNPAILEIGRFSDLPILADLQTLTFEDRDLEDLKECVVGDCKVKLSATMIERLHKDVDWEATDYRVQATQLLKRMLLDYVQDYEVRGDSALIKYHDNSVEVGLAEEQRELAAAPGCLNKLLSEFQQTLKRQTGQPVFLVENALVWSKIKFGLKPVIALNHIMVYRRAAESGPQILVVSKQIYANHYFDSSLALTAFVNIPGATPGSYLLYENRSRADGLQGPFSKIKRGIVEGKAVSGLKGILESSKANLDAHAFSKAESAQPPDKEGGWRRWRIGRVHVFLWLLLIPAFIALFALGNYGWKGSFSGEAQQ
jgi:hypothetical protein